MAVLRRTASIGASASVDDQLTVDGIRDSLKTAQRPGLVSVYATISAIGIRLALLGQNRIIGSNLEPFISASGPLLDGQHFLGAYPIARGEVVALQVQNTTGAPITLNYHIDLP